MGILFTHGIITSCMGQLENTESLGCSCFPKLLYFITQYEKITLINVTSDLIRKKKNEVLHNCQAHGNRLEFSKIIISA